MLLYGTCHSGSKLDRGREQRGVKGRALCFWYLGPPSAVRRRRSVDTKPGAFENRQDSKFRSTLQKRLIKMMTQVFVRMNIVPPLLNIMNIGKGVLLLCWLTTRDAINVRGVCRELRALVTNFPWDVRAEALSIPPRLTIVKAWRACFPKAISILLQVREKFWESGDHPENLDQHDGVTDDILALLRGMQHMTINDTAYGSINVTDAGFAHLVGIRTLKFDCHNAKITDAAFEHLAGIHTLIIWGNWHDFGGNVTDTALHYLVGIHTLDISCQSRITEDGVAKLVGITNLIGFPS
jgi:hypothetical protein